MQRGGGTHLAAAVPACEGHALVGGSEMERGGRTRREGFCAAKVKQLPVGQRVWGTVIELHRPREHHDDLGRGDLVRVGSIAGAPAHINSGLFRS